MNQKSTSDCAVVATARVAGCSYGEALRCFDVREHWRLGSGGFPVRQALKAVQKATGRRYVARRNGGSLLDNAAPGTILLCQRWNGSRFNHWIARTRLGWFDPITGTVLSSRRRIPADSFGTALCPDRELRR